MNTIPQKIVDLGLSEDDTKGVWATLIALAVLERQHKAKEGEWMLIAKKAKSYLKKKGISADLQIYLELTGI